MWLRHRATTVGAGNDNNTPTLDMMSELQAYMLGPKLRSWPEIVKRHSIGRSL